MARQDYALRYRHAAPFSPTISSDEPTSAPPTSRALTNGSNDSVDVRYKLDKAKLAESKSSNHETSKRVIRRQTGSI